MLIWCYWNVLKTTYYYVRRQMSSWCYWDVYLFLIGCYHNVILIDWKMYMQTHVYNIMMTFVSWRTYMWISEHSNNVIITYYTGMLKWFYFSISALYVIITLLKCSEHNISLRQETNVIMMLLVCFFFVLDWMLPQGH